jgi:hypothetical protein
MRRSRIFLILDVALLRLRSKKSCGLASDRNLRFPGAVMGDGFVGLMGTLRFAHPTGDGGL